MSDPTRFDLDDRQRAMLAEMGVRVWWPSSASAPLPAGNTLDAAPAAGQANPLAVAGAAAALVTPGTAEPSRAQPVPPNLDRSGPAARSQRAAVAVPPAASLVVSGGAFSAVPDGVSSMGWDELQTTVNGCTSCALCSARKAPLLGSGHAQASWMVVGDLPAEEDDQTGQTFTGKEGQLLDNMLKAVGVRRVGMARPDEVLSPRNEAYLTHAVKCRPPGGRNPEAAELAVCSAYLSRQVALVRPQVILAMGRFAIQTLLGSTEPMGKLRGRLHDFQGVPVVVTYHPSSLLRNSADKAKAWADLVLALKVVKA
ncbi:uracil-DNA glycosylase [Limnohabitans sp. 2KL-1]|uniref:uracil-DNA glycosylase n=1 Tax=Limnohabitans sp. 2KL-1 TaxID=1100699 RepID=UPI000D33A1A8|nr:uracil-DNA glycosylase [Limnohabitans sp. 2KL-1]PUE46827.1 uracil-DNA glycosylase [Limnohabitans sp. 2KL-1]